MRVDVDIWRFQLDEPGTSAHRLLVRSTLARYVGRDPATLEFTHGAHGKPSLRDADDLQFSASRSGNVGLLAITRGVDVGVDVERLEGRRAFGPIADQLFAADEVAELRSLSAQGRIRRFFELWTRKEAHAKALGVGLSVPLDRLGAQPGWSVDDLPLGSDFAGAVCARGRRLRVRMCR